MRAILALFFAVASSGGQASGQPAGAEAASRLVRCAVPRSGGGAGPESATTNMTVVSDGHPCGVPNWGVPSERRNPATAADITLSPRHGKVEFVAPLVEYTAEAGYVGSDEFAYETNIRNSVGASVVLRVRVEVDVREAWFALATAAGAPPPRVATPLIAGSTPDESVNPDFEKGEGLLQRRQYDEALKAFRRANENGGNRCAECHYGIAKAYEGLGASKNVIESCDRAIELGGSDSGNGLRLQVAARQTKGLALQALAELKDRKKLRDAEAEFRSALALDPDAAFLHFNLGVVLMQEERDAEGIEEVKQELSLRPKSVHAEMAALLIANPRRARETYAPPFSIVTLSKELLELDGLRGKVVLLDFWGTWCQPCVQAVPVLQDIQKRHAKDPFVLIGVSSDREEELVQSFVSKHQMSWPEYLDREKVLHRVYEVRVWPTYVVIDDEGIVRFRTTGNKRFSGAMLEDEVRRQLKLAAARPKSN